MKEHWFLVAEDILLDALTRAKAGEDPDALLMELWATGKHYDDPDDDEIVNDKDTGVTTFTLTPEGDQ